MPIRSPKMLRAALLVASVATAVGKTTWDVLQVGLISCIKRTLSYLDVHLTRTFSRALNFYRRTPHIATMTGVQRVSGAFLVSDVAIGGLWSRCAEYSGGCDH